MQQQQLLRQEQQVEMQQEMQTAPQSFREQRAQQPLAQPLQSRMQQEEKQQQHRLLLRHLSEHKLFTDVARPFPLFRPQGRPRVYSFSGVVNSNRNNEADERNSAYTSWSYSTRTTAATPVSLAFREIPAAAAAAPHVVAGATVPLPSSPFNRQEAAAPAAGAFPGRRPSAGDDFAVAVAAASARRRSIDEGGTGAAGGGGAAAAGGQYVAVECSPHAAARERGIRRAAGGEPAGGGEEGGRPSLRCFAAAAAARTPSRQGLATAAGGGGAVVVAAAATAARPATIVQEGIPPLRTAYCTLFPRPPTSPKISAAAGGTATVITTAAPTAATSTATLTTASPPITAPTNRTIRHDIEAPFADELLFPQEFAVAPASPPPVRQERSFTREVTTTAAAGAAAPPRRWSMTGAIYRTARNPSTAATAVRGRLPLVRPRYFPATLIAAPPQNIPPVFHAVAAAGSLAVTARAPAAATAAAAGSRYVPAMSPSAARTSPAQATGLPQPAAAGSASAAPAAGLPSAAAAAAGLPPARVAAGRPPGTAAAAGLPPATAAAGRPPGTAATATGLPAATAAAGRPPGTAATATGLPAATAAAERRPPGTAATATGLPAATAAAERRPPGTAAATGFPPTTTATGFPPTTTATGLRPTTAAAGRPPGTAAAAAGLPPATAAAAGRPPGTAATAGLPAATAAATGLPPATAAAGRPPATAAATGFPPATTAAAGLPPATAAAARPSGTAAAAAGLPAATAGHISPPRHVATAVPELFPAGTARFVSAAGPHGARLAAAEPAPPTTSSPPRAAKHIRQGEAAAAGAVEAPTRNRAEPESRLSAGQPLRRNDTKCKLEGEAGGSIDLYMRGGGSSSSLNNSSSIDSSSSSVNSRSSSSINSRSSSSVNSRSSSSINSRSSSSVNSRSGNSNMKSSSSLDSRSDSGSSESVGSVQDASSRMQSPWSGKADDETFESCYSDSKSESKSSSSSSTITTRSPGAPSKYSSNTSMSRSGVEAPADRGMLTCAPPAAASCFAGVAATPFPQAAPAAAVALESSTDSGAPVLVHTAAVTFSHAETLNRIPTPNNKPCNASVVHAAAAATALSAAASVNRLEHMPAPRRGTGSSRPSSLQALAAACASSRPPAAVRVACAAASSSLSPHAVKEAAGGGGGGSGAGGHATAAAGRGGDAAGQQGGKTHSDEKRYTSASMLSNKILEEMEGPLRGKLPLIVGSQSHTAHRFFPHLPPVQKMPANSYAEDGTPLLHPPAGKKNAEKEVPLHVRIAMDFRQDQVHPAVLRLGLQMGSRKVEGTNARTVAMLTAFQRFIEDYCPPPYEAMDKHLKIMLDRQINFITHCRPHSLAMGATIRWLKKRVSNCARLPLHETKAALCFYISTFISERIVTATLAVADFLQDLMVRNGDCLLIYGYSTAVVRGLCQAKRQGRRFSVIVVDARPYLTGRRAAMELAEAGVEITYTLLNGVAYHMDSATRVILGAAALLSNAAVVNRAGAAIVAMIARSYNKPVVVCSELYKTFDRILLDSAAFNELDDPYMVWPETPAAAAAAAARRAAQCRGARRKGSLARASSLAAAASSSASAAAGGGDDEEDEEEEEDAEDRKKDEGEIEGSSSSSCGSSGARSCSNHRKVAPSFTHLGGVGEGRYREEDAAAETVNEAVATTQGGTRDSTFHRDKTVKAGGREDENKTAGAAAGHGALDRRARINDNRGGMRTGEDSKQRHEGDEEQPQTALSGFSPLRFKRPPRLGAAAAALLSSSLAECRSGPAGARKPARSLADIAAALANKHQDPAPADAPAATTTTVCTTEQGGDTPAFVVAVPASTAAATSHAEGKAAVVDSSQKHTSTALPTTTTYQASKDSVEIAVDCSTRASAAVAVNTSTPPGAVSGGVTDRTTIGIATEENSNRIACVSSSDVWSVKQQQAKSAFASSSGVEGSSSFPCKSVSVVAAPATASCSTLSSVALATEGKDVAAADTSAAAADGAGAGAAVACETDAAAHGAKEASARAADGSKGSPAAAAAPAAATSSSSSSTAAPGSKRSAGGRSGGGGGGPAAPEICVMNLCYDVTPAEFIDYFITEDGIFPTSNMPVLVRNIAN